MAMAMVNSSRLPVSDDDESEEEPVSDWAGISTTSMIVAFTVFDLLAKRRRSHTSSELSSTLQEASSDDDGDNVCHGDSPSPRLVLAFLMNPKKHLERLLEDKSYTPYTVLKYSDDSSVLSDVGTLEDAPAPDGFAARIDALQDALLSSYELQYIAEIFPRDFAGFIRLVVFGMAMFICVGLRIMVFVVTGRMCCRGIQLLFNGFKDGKCFVRSSSLFDYTMLIHFCD